jgi:hypothetical protein
MCVTVRVIVARLFRPTLHCFPLENSTGHTTNVCEEVDEIEVLVLLQSFGLRWCIAACGGACVFKAVLHCFK